MRHIFFINQLEKLNIRKDSSLMMALSFKKRGEEVYLLFENDFYVRNHGAIDLNCYSFTGNFIKDSFYIEAIELGASTIITIGAADIFHMRIDPPVDVKYIRYLWMQQMLEVNGVNVVNAPRGILQYNEKILAYSYDQYSIKTFLGSSVTQFEKFIDELKASGVDEIILKPIDLFCGIGVEKLSINDPHLMDIFKQRVLDFAGAIIGQPFMKEVYRGEFRTIYFDGKELGTIKKTPPPGEFLANIARGATYQVSTINDKLKSACDDISAKLLNDGVRLVAFDLLGDSVTEVNITCPGLILEMSQAYNKNLSFQILDQLYGAKS